MKTRIGNTPLIPLPTPFGKLLGKAEWYNPTGSVKDRTAHFMLRQAQQQGQLHRNGTVLEATSGNTGIALAALSAAMGYRCILVMPENMNRERRLLMESYAAAVRLSPAADGMAGAVALAQQIAQSDENCFYVNQFENPANISAHYMGTGPEIWAQTRGSVEIFIAGIGSGGSITGVGRFLKQQNSAIQIVAVEPAMGDSIPGLGAGFVAPILDRNIIDEYIPVTAAAAATASRSLAQRHGLLVGISAAAAYHVGCLLLSRPENTSKTAVVLLPDSGERYLSTGLL